MAGIEITKHDVPKYHFVTVRGYIGPEFRNSVNDYGDIFGLVLLFYAKPIIMNIKYEKQIKYILYDPVNDKWDDVSLKILTTIGYDTVPPWPWSLDNLHYQHGIITKANFDHCRWDETDIFSVAFTNYEKCILALTSITKQHPNIVEEFANWYEDGAWEDDGLNDEFLDLDAEESSFVDWIKEKNPSITDEECLQIWEVCHNAIKNIPAPPSPQNQNQNQQRDQPSPPALEIHKTKISSSIIVELLSIPMDPNERKQAIESSLSPLKKRIVEQCPSMLPVASSQGGFGGNDGKRRKNEAQDILTVQLLGYKNNNYPILLHFVDSYVRCQLNEWIASGKDLGSSFSSAAEFFKGHCTNPDFQCYLKKNTSQPTIDFVVSAMDSFQKRVLTPFRFMEPIYKINDDVLDISQYLFHMAHVVRSITTEAIVPIQIDFMILNGKIEDSRPVDRHRSCFGDWDDWDDYDDEDGESSDEEGDIAADMEQLLKSKGIYHYVYEKPLRAMLLCAEHIKRVVNTKRSQRTVFVIDRRKNKDRLYLFQPKKYNQFEANHQELVHSALHHNSISSVIPRAISKGKDDDFGVRDGLRGQMFVMSFHILSREEIRCYLWREGQCFRFYGEDLMNVVPMFFCDRRQARERLSKMYGELEWRQAFHEFCDTFVDKRFDQFYFGLTGKTPRVAIPWH